VQLSVILPNFQHGHVITRALDALLAQDRKPDEIVVVDDASTDHSVGVIERAAARAREIRLLVNDANTGAIASLKRGLEDARGCYVYFAAADDWVMPHFFAMALEALEANPKAGLFCGDAMLVDATNDRTLGFRPPVRPLARAGYVDPAATARLLARSDNWILTGSAVFRRTAIADAGGLDEELGSFADGFLARKISLMCGFCYAPQVVAAWCVHPSGLSRSAALDPDRAGRVLALVTRKIAADPVFPPWYVERFADRWRFATARLALQASPRNDAIVTLGARSGVDRALLGLASRLPGRQLATLATLAWLWLRFRPYRLRDLIRTAALRRRMSTRAL
jgi:glycosyltransferase involved in cell wall biosynthesis